MSLIATSTYANSKEIFNEWGKPQFIYDSWIFGIGHDSATNIPDKTFWLMDKKRANNAGDEAIIMIYSARIIVKNGGYFCATQIRSRNKGKSGCPEIWTQYQNPDGDFEKNCFWLCEPGHSGEGCKSGRITSAAQCMYTNLTPDVLRDGISYNETGSNDRASVEANMYSNTYQGFFKAEYRRKKSDESDVILAAQSYLPNGHGIVASPATVAAHGGMWTNDDYSDTWLDCKYGDSNLTITAKTANYQTKTLCMPGFDGPGCTTSICSECTDPLTRFNETTGYCSDCIENHIHDKSGKCVPCAAGETAVPEKDICLVCKKTEYIKDGECTPRDQISKQELFNCYPNENATDFALCIKKTCDNDKVVSCITNQKKLGKKKCTNGKWDECIVPKKN